MKQTGAEIVIETFIKERINAPIVASMTGLKAVPHDFPDFFRIAGISADAAASKALENCDLIIALGTRFSNRTVGNRPWQRQ